MRILSLYVENFGVLHQYSLDLAPGLNTLVRPNGWGKSSLAVFIKAMLYGLPASTRRSLIENERKRYTPWQGGLYGGTMDVEMDGRRLRIERSFGKTESMDTLSITDLDTGVSLPTFGKNSLGEEWFGVDGAAYERSTYLSQRDCDNEDGSLSIHAKLNRLVDATDDIGNYDNAMALLEKQRKYYTMNNGRRGCIADGEQELQQLERRISEALFHRQEAALCSEQLAHMEQDLRYNMVEGERLAGAERAAHAARERKAHCLHHQDLMVLANREKAEYTRTMLLLDDHMPREEDIVALSEVEQRTEGLRREEQRLASSLDEQQPLAREMRDLCVLFGDHIPDEMQLSALSRTAELAKTTAVIAREAREQLHEMPPAGEDMSDTDERGLQQLQKWQKLCLRYPQVRMKAMEVRDKAAADLSQAKIQAEKATKKKTLCGVFAAVTMLAGLAVAGVLLAFSRVGAAMTVGGVAVIMAAVWCLILWRGFRNGTAMKQAEQQAVEALQQAQEKCDQLAEQWQQARKRIKELFDADVTDAGEALEVLVTYERSFSNRTVLQQERAMAYDAQVKKVALLEQEAERAWSDFAALWHWDDLPAAQDAPIAAERISQKYHRYHQLHRDAQSATDELAALRGELENLAKRRRALLAAYSHAPEKEGARWLREIAQAASHHRERMERLLSDAESFAAEHQVKGAPPPEGEQALSDIAEIEAKRERLRLEQEELQRRLAMGRRELETHAAYADQLESLEDEAEQLRQRLVAERASLETVLEAQKFMKSARESLSGRYLQTMQDNFARYYALLTGEDDVAFTMDGSFAVKLRQSGASRVKDAFSTGWRDIISLATRLSLVDTLFEGETPFLVLDDPFCNMDDEMTTRAWQLLESVAQRYQVLYLTCHSSRA